MITLSFPLGSWDYAKANYDKGYVIVGSTQGINPTVLAHELAHIRLKHSTVPLSWHTRFLREVDAWDYALSRMPKHSADPYVFERGIGSYCSSRIERKAVTQLRRKHKNKFAQHVPAKQG